MEHPGSESLQWVSKDLNAAVQDARLALEEYVEGGASRRSLESFVQRCHVIQGVLRMVEVYGAALLAEEMEKAAQYLLKGGTAVKNEEETLDALTRAMVQLPAYLERLVSGGRDIALVLLPLLNDLRAVRGQPLLSEGTLLLLNITPAQKTAAFAVTPREPVADVDAVQLARLLRPRFQLALLGWIKGERGDANLAVLGEVTEKLEQAATDERSYRLWVVVGAVVEALRESGLDSNVSLKRLLGQADRAIKRLIDCGEARLFGNGCEELLNNLLYYVARADSSGERVRLVRRLFELEDLLPSDAMVEHARESLSGPSVKLMQTVAAAIKEDLARVKDTLDIFVRTGKKSHDELGGQADLLKKISDTLGVLGLGGLRGRVQAELDALQGMSDGSAVAEDAALERIAATLLHVEDSLDEQLLSLIMPVGVPVAMPESEDGDQDSEYRQVTEAVVRECILNLTRVKDAIAQAVDQPHDVAVMESLPPLLRGITAALLMLNRTRAVAVVERIGELAQRVFRADQPPLLADKIDRLADSIVSLEYYLETIQAGRADPWYMLDNAESCLRFLEDAAAKAAAMPVSDAAPEATLVLGAQAHDEIVAAEAETRVIGESGAVTPPPQAPEPVQPDETAEKPALVAMRPATDGTGPDPDILELFIEEAKDELEQLSARLPAWLDDPSDQEALAFSRRSFHTLKGSGRMVGAEAIGELGWAIENLLNKTISGTLQRTPGLLALLRQSLELLPVLIEQLEIGVDPDPVLQRMIRQAEGLVRGEEPTVALSRELAVTSPTITEFIAPEPEPAEPSDLAQIEAEEEVATLAGLDEMDPVLKEIFTKETGGHLEAIRAYLRDCEAFGAPYSITEALHRSCHTLSGSANMAGVAVAVEVATPWNAFLRKLYDAGLGLSAEGLETCGAVVAAMEAIVARLKHGFGDVPDVESLVARIGWLDAEFERNAHEHEPDVADQGDGTAWPAEFDTEIAAIFCEEATELLEATEQSFGAWSFDWSGEEAVAELRRHLHTLKGGARMAGLRPMGDLSHELETLLIRVGGGDVATGESLRTIFQNGIDELHRMREAVTDGAYPEPGTKLIAAIRDFSAGKIADTTEAGEQQAGALPEHAAFEPADTVAPAIGDADDLSEAEAEADVEGEFRGEAPEALEAEASAGFAAAAGSDEVVEAGERDEAEARVEPQQPSTATVAAAAKFGDDASAPAEAATARQGRGEVARVDADLLEELLNNAGEVSIFRSRLDQQVKSVEFNLAELAQTVSRLKDQLRKLEIETEAQIIHRHQKEIEGGGDFDPLELDRYSLIQQLSRALAETASDVDSIRSLMHGQIRDADALLVQQGRVTTAIQHGLMRTRMVPFERHGARLSRVVRQVAAEVGKRAELELHGSGELDRQVLERMLSPLEHMLRNAVVHGIESPQQRRAAGKPETGKITVNVRREGAEVLVEIGDDGSGLDIAAIRENAVARGLVGAGKIRSDQHAIQLIFEPGFSTASELTQAAGRGVGMEVVANEVRRLGGSISVTTEQGKGTSFLVRLPFTLAIAQAMIVRVNDEYYALPLTSVEGIARIPREQLLRKLEEQDPSYEYGGQDYRFQYLAQYVGAEITALSEDTPSVPVVLVRAGEYSTALIGDELLGSREVVVKSVGPQLATIDGIAGATIMGDGRIAIILDAPTLLRTAVQPAATASAAEVEDRRTFVLVVDDSITVRRVTQRLLERNGMRVVTAKDGVDALAILQEHLPDVILLDIEMPRMDGYELAGNIRNDHRLENIPIIMITSRVGSKHRARAIELGVDDYLGKPYQEAQLLDAIEPLVNEGRTGNERIR